MAYFVIPDGTRVEDPRYTSVVEFAHAYGYRVEEVGLWLPKPPADMVLDTKPVKKGKKDA